MLKLVSFAKNQSQTHITVEGSEDERDKLAFDLWMGSFKPTAKAVETPAVEQPKAVRAEAPKPAPKPTLAAVPPPAVNPTPAATVVANDDDDDDEASAGGSVSVPESVAKASKSKEVVVAVRELLGPKATQADIVTWCTARYAAIPALTMHGSLDAAIDRVKRSCMVLSIS
jgi:hypothetical protein